MLIRSQSKKQLINFNNYHGVAISYKSDCDFGVCAVYEMPSQEVAQVEMGNYSSEEKAVKVLDMICGFANSKHYEKVAPEQCGYFDGVVFQKPQDTEV